MTEGDIPLYEADASSTQSELEKAAIREGNVQRYFFICKSSVYFITRRFKKVFEPVRANMTDSEISSGYEIDISHISYKSGLCFGMTAISVLVHNGELTPSDLQEGAETLYDVTLTDDVDALIAYYNSLQLYTEVELAIIAEPAMLSKEEHTDMFLDCATRCKEKALTLWQVFPPKKAAHTLCWHG